MQKRIFSLIAIICILTGCSLDSTFLGREYKKIKDLDFGATIQLKSEPLSYIKNQLVRPAQLLLMNDLLLVTDNKSEKPLHVINLKEQKYLGQFINKGEGPNEISSPWKLSKVDENSFIITDIRQRKYLGYTLENLLASSTPFTEEKTVQTGFVSSFFYDKDHNKLFYTGNLTDNYRLHEKNLNSKEVKGYATLLEADSGSNTIEVKNHLSHTGASANKDYSLFVFSYIYSPILETYNIKTKELKTVVIPHDNEPIYRSRINEGVTEVAVTQTSLLEFTSSIISDKYIYALYAGRPIFEETPHNSTIYVFDHDLNPIKKYSLNEEIDTFVIKDDNILYGLDNITEIYPRILKYKLD